MKQNRLHRFKMRARRNLPFPVAADILWQRDKKKFNFEYVQRKFRQWRRMPVVFVNKNDGPLCVTPEGVNFKFAPVSRDIPQSWLDNMRRRENT